MYGAETVGRDKGACSLEHVESRRSARLIGHKDTVCGKVLKANEASEMV